jgi:hypothetical protein
MEIKVGGYDVYKEGTVIGNLNEPIDFNMNKETGFVIRISFITDSVKADTRIEGEPFDKKGGHLKFINFNNSLGIGNTAPLLIGHLNKRELFLNYRVYSLENAGKTFHFTWLLGKEVQDGK